MAFPGISTAQTWLASFQQPLKNLIENPLRRSTVPQFIIDARHPWILANQRKLERLSNNEAFLCSAPDSITSSAGTKRETFTEEEFKVPLDLFSKLEIDNNRWPISRPGWANALERLGEMKRCPRALDQVKMLDVDISIHDSKYSDLHLRILEPSQPPEQLLILFGDVLETMPNLEALKWRIPQKYIHFFESTFKSRNLTLSSIKHLEPGLSHYMVAMCPNLEELESERDGSGLLLIEAALSAPKLKRFAMEGDQFDGWTPELISEVVKAMPRLESLGLRGSLGQRPFYGESTGDTGRLKAALELLTGLEKLKHLNLPHASDLGLGFDGGPGCGNAYDGKEGQEYLREVTREGIEAIEKGGNIVVANMPHLTSFTIGGSTPNITRGEDGMINATWPWTGRFEDWLMEAVPDLPEFDDVEYGSM